MFAETISITAPHFRYKQPLEDTNASPEDEWHYGRSVSEAAQYDKLWLLRAPRY